MSNKVEKTAIGQILDAETGEWVEITKEKQSLANYVHQQILIGVFVSAMSIKKMLDEKLYLYLGCQTKDEYIDTSLPYGRTQAYRLVKIADKFSGALNMQIGEGNGMPLLTSGDDDKAQEIQSLGMAKLYEIATLTDDDVNEFVKKGSLKVADSDYTIEEIREMTVKELNKAMADVKKKQQAKINQLTEDNRLLQEENKTYGTKIEKLSADVENAKELERLYGAVASTRKQKKEYLHKAQEQLNELIETVFRIGINEEDSANDQQDLVNFIKKYNEAGERILENYQAVTVNFQ